MRDSCNRSLTVKTRSHIRCAALCCAARCCALLRVAFRSTAACFSVMNIHNVEKIWLTLMMMMCCC